MATQSKLTAIGQLRNAIFEARANSDRLFEIVREDSLYERPIPERNRIVFYIGHLEAFDWNLFRSHLFSLESRTPVLDKLFAFGIDPVDGGLPTDQPGDWPPLGEVRNYAQTLRDLIDDALDAGAFPLAQRPDGFSPEFLLRVAYEHRLMHVETLAYMFHRLPYAQKNARSQDSVSVAPFVNEMLEIPSGQATLGLSGGPSAVFGWDNEFESSTAGVPHFRIDKYMVSNAEFLRFVEAGGYRNPQLWSPEDWQWKERHSIFHPAFWNQPGSTWTFRGMFEELPFPSNWPVYVSHAEASAYARWAGKSLPTEAQWHRAAYGTPRGMEQPYPWGADDPSFNPGNYDFRRWDPAPVNAFPANKSAFGVVGQLGNGWEWTSTLFAPFPGFQPFPFYPGYSANFFDGKHFVIKGGSARSASCFLRRSFRNWFQPHYQNVYAGFRCVSE
ncbi:MAG TPA: SUMF1/EgtB/PvdO family nonheme iron enzyme [Candidatus Sulfotelmatobacter sp.]|jgi:iron(II)-dependent oxidoreductase|nr:SUMF1/EgtB/PvdO family nonheme iron enzyme [Candidatus Sulfotelmatobacter sp.]